MAAGAPRVRGEDVGVREARAVGARLGDGADRAVALRALAHLG
jgi:hypothetical protein